MYVRETIERMTKDIDPRWIEAWMRSERNTFDGLSRQQLAEAVLQGLADALDAETQEPGMSEKLAQSYGL